LDSNGFWHYSKILAIESLLPPRPGDNILDVGCGSGVISGFLGSKGATVVGIDTNPDAISFAEKKYAGPTVSFKLELADRISGMDGSIDKIYCLELIEHIYLPQSKAMLDCFYRLLKPGGSAFLTTPNYHSLWPLIEWLMDRLHFAPQMADHQHVEKFNRRKLRELSLSCNFSVQTLRAMCFVAPWIAPISWRLAKKTSKIEFAAPQNPGSILTCVLIKRG
jgi:2-polyprenyl-3-methyl-5-hydroxy-6-metoxy-1,4-benzoquinol methylase